MNINSRVYRMVVIGLAALWMAGLLFAVQPVLSSRAAGQIDLIGPAGSDQFGKNVVALPNGNIVVTDPLYNNGTAIHTGAVYLYNGTTGAMISKLTGTALYDGVGYVEIVVLSNGNFVVRSPNWNNGIESDAGAVTWCSGTTGCNGVVSSSNSLVGTTGNDMKGANTNVIPLSNGNYVVINPNWANGDRGAAGAVTWCNGLTGCRGEISASNSLVGSAANNMVGFYGITVLTDDRYIVRSPFWDHGMVINAGALTWCSGTSGCTGEISAANSLIGTSANDLVGYNAITVLSNGNNVVSTPGWDNGDVVDAGAVTWCSSSSGCTGEISADNSLVGSTAYDQTGSFAVISLTNGNYVVPNQSWDNAEAVDTGAVTWCSGEVGCTGPISAANSLVGSTSADVVGIFVTALTDGSYMVNSPYWSSDTAMHSGAVTWCDGASGCSGTISSINSLVGSTDGDYVGAFVKELNHDAYVVSSPSWSNDQGDQVGAVTWCSIGEGCSGPVSSTNSLVGSTAGDQVGNVVVLSDGNYVVVSPLWTNGSVLGAGAVTWCDGTSGCLGLISPENSLVGSAKADWVGERSVVPLHEGNYVVLSPDWNYGQVLDAGAVTWCNGAGHCTGEVSESNSLVGGTARDQVGSSVAVLKNGSYVVSSNRWTNDSIPRAGAVTWCSGSGGCSGPVSSANSLVGGSSDDEVGLGVYGNAIIPLAKGGYLVNTRYWDNGSTIDVGAVTWCSGVAICSGKISAANSLVGSHVNDLIGFDDILPLKNGNYVVGSSGWDNGSLANAGAVTWCSGATGCHGEVSFSNSLVGSALYDGIGGGGIRELGDGSYVVFSPFWANGAVEKAGAVTWCGGTVNCNGAIFPGNSVVGLAAGGQVSSSFAFDSINHQLVVGRPAENRVTLLRTNIVNQVYLPLLRR